MTSDKPRVGFIGLGLMGHGIAKNLVSKGFPLTVRIHRNRKPAEDILAAGAEEGRLNTMVGADDATFAQIKPVLAAYCENVIHVGPAGHGHMLKLINNFIAQAIATATAEACAACAKSGVSIKKLHEIISAGGVNSGIFQMMVGKMLESGDLSGLKFTLANAMKDLRYYTHFAESLPVPAIVGLKITIQVIDSIDSTNSELLRRAARADVHRHLLVAERQQAGRGRRGREWSALAGGSLTFSLGWRFERRAAQLGGLSLAAG